MQKAPLALVKDRFKDKNALVAAVEKLMNDKLWVDRINGDKGLKSVSNRRLLHLHDVLDRVKADFGSRDKLIDAIVETSGRSKDADYRSAISGYSTPRLVDLHGAAQKRKNIKTKPAPKAAKKAAPKKTGATKKAAGSPRSAASLKSRLAKK